MDQEFIRIWREFQHEANVSTQFLLYTLNGIHALHRDALQSHGSIPSVSYPPVRGFPLVVFPSLLDSTKPDGPMEDMAFTSWTVDVYDRLWEGRYRGEQQRVLKQSGLPDAIRPRTEVLGDLRLIRNNLLHGRDRADEAAKCRVLRWFRKGEPVRVRLRHVLDFLNQMGWLVPEPISLGKAGFSLWHVRTDNVPLQPPRLISVRHLLDPEQDDPRYRYAASIAFEDGVFALVPMGPSAETPEQAAEWTRLWPGMAISADGSRLVVPGLSDDGIPAGQLYLNSLAGPHTKRPAPWSPAVKISASRSSRSRSVQPYRTGRANLLRTGAAPAAGDRSIRSALASGACPPGRNPTSGSVAFLVFLSAPAWARFVPSDSRHPDEVELRVSRDGIRNVKQVFPSTLLTAKSPRLMMSMPINTSSCSPARAARRLRLRGIGCSGSRRPGFGEPGTDR